jgi:hypothetical protein
MNVTITNLSPSVTSLLRADHTKVLATFHRYKTDSAPRTKQALVDAVCLSIEIHAQVEEEILYAAMRAADPALVEKSMPEHEEMRRLIHALRNMPPTDATYDAVFMELMRNVIHHVADEETILLPEAERLFRERVHELGAQLTRRKLQLTRRRVGEMARNAARAMPATTIVAGAGAVLAGAYLLRHFSKR